MVLVCSEVTPEKHNTEITNTLLVMDTDILIIRVVLRLVVHTLNVSIDINGLFARKSDYAWISNLNCALANPYSSVSFSTLAEKKGSESVDKFIVSAAQTCSIVLWVISSKHLIFGSTFI